MTATIGDNSGAVPPQQLRAFVERIERLNSEMSDIKEDVKEIYKEAKDSGFDVKIMRKLISRRAKDQKKLREEEEMLDLYVSALGLE